MSGMAEVLGEADRYRFWSKVDKSGDCWIWTGATRSGIYGRFRLNGKHPQAHRVSYEMANGPIPAGMVIDHICHVTQCVNPEHLRPATKKQNAENHAGAYCNGQSGIRGVNWHSRDHRWAARVRHNGRLIVVGYFAEAHEAEAAVIAKRNELFTHNDIDRVSA